MKFLILDANILIRSVLGNKVSALITEMQSEVAFFTPDVCLQDAHKYLPGLMERKGVDPDMVIDLLNKILECIQVLPFSLYGKYEEQARQRIEKRDVNDWPIVASALALDCPIWTEDTDFFGTGIAIWTTDRVVLYTK